jgi:hypothetical protein
VGGVPADQRWLVTLARYVEVCQHLDGGEVWGWRRSAGCSSEFRSLWQVSANDAPFPPRPLTPAATGERAAELDGGGWRGRAEQGIFETLV